MKKEIKDILESDLLERFVLGDVSDLERQKVISWRSQSNEVRDTLMELEESLERLALENKQDIPQSVKSKILNKPYSSAARPASKKIASSWISWAACLLLGFACSWVYQQQKINSISETNEIIQNELSLLKEECNRTRQRMAFINDNNTVPMFLKGTANAPESGVIIYWNETKKACQLKVANLPNIPANKTYQLWADVEGEMLNLGIFDYKEASIEAIPMAYLDNAESLNITIEKEGGSDHPDVSTLTASVAI